MVIRVMNRHTLWHGKDPLQRDQMLLVPVPCDTCTILSAGWVLDCIVWIINRFPRSTQFVEMALSNWERIVIVVKRIVHWLGINVVMDRRAVCLLMQVSFPLDLLLSSFLRSGEVCCFSS